jgi:hypothetical protein
MALKVVPAGDERCDIHNGRKPPAYICKDCLKDLGVETTEGARRPSIRDTRRALRRPIRTARRALRRSTGRRRLPIAAGLGLLIAVAAVVVALASGGGGGDTATGLPTEAEVVEALELSPNPSGTGWITLDGECAVLSIRIGTTPTTQPVSPETIAMNETGNVRAVVVNAFSQSQAACVDRISAELRDHF